MNCQCYKCQGSIQHPDQSMAASYNASIPIRTFTTGATRDTDQSKPVYDGFLSHEVLVRYGQYMSKHRLQADGGVRPADNWKKGMPRTEYISSAFRHFLDVWARPDDEDALCALMFNTMGLLYEVLLKREVPPNAG